MKTFCSTAEMLGWALQPESQRSNVQLYVHDTARSDWNYPDDKHLINAREAWYVSGTGHRAQGTGLKGAMGAVLAPFADEQAAHALAAETGGRVLRFQEIDQQILQQAAAMENKRNAGQHGSH